MPVPVGGGVNLVNALLGIITDAGGQLFLNSDVKKLIVQNGKARGVICSDGQSITASRAVLASVTPQFLYETLLGDTNVETAALTAAKNFRYGRAAIQINIAMNEKPKWSDPRLNDVAIVHAIATADLDLEPRPDAEGAADSSAADSGAKSFSEDHGSVGPTLHLRPHHRENPPGGERVQH